MDEILFFLLKNGAHMRPFKITTTELGAELDMSQQNASRKLVELEEDGYLERSNEGMKLTKKGYDQLAKTYASLKQVFEKGHVEMNGNIVEGVGEGSYYMSMKGYTIKEKINFDPYPGTLNVKLDDEDLTPDNFESIEIIEWNTRRTVVTFLIIGGIIILVPLLFLIIFRPTIYIN